MVLVTRALFDYYKPMVILGKDKPILEIFGRNSGSGLSQKLILVALFLSIATGRWGSWIGIPNTPLYFIDCILASACLLSIPTALKTKQFYLPFSFLLFIYIAFEFISSDGFSATIRLRDLAPFIYLSLVPFFSLVISKSNLRTIIVCLRYATLINATWSLAATTGLISQISLGGVFQVPIFSTRWDQTGLALAIGVIAWSRFPTVQLPRNPLVLSLLFLTAISQGSRAGLIAYAIGGLYVLTRKTDNGIIPKMKIFFVLIFLLISFFGFSFIKTYAPANSALNRVNVQYTSLNQSNTVSARVNAQKLLIDYWLNSGKILFGVGPGDEMIIKSGSLIYLSGSPDVRSPHSWVVGLLCRFGIVGFLIWFFYPLRLLMSKRINGDFVADIKIILVAILFLAQFGVIIESPFGSIPFCILLAVLVVKKFEYESH